MKEKIYVNESHYKYKIKRMMKFDIKKIFINNNEGNNNRYFTMTKVSIERSFAYSKMFSNFELHFFLNQTSNSLLNMVPYSFPNILFDGLDCDISKHSFFDKLECLNGLTVADLFLKDPVMISKALKQDFSKIKQRQMNYEVYSDFSDEIRKNASESGFLNDNFTYLSSDFTQINQL